MEKKKKTEACQLLHSFFLFRVKQVFGTSKFGRY